MGSKATGTTVHEVVHQLLTTETVTASGSTKFSGKDMVAAGALFQYVGEVMQRRRFTRLSEETFVADWLKSKPKTTPDLVLYTKDEIHVIDSKWGKIPVEAYGNEQLLFYAVCVAHLAPKAEGVTVHIAQPRAQGGPNFEEWFVSAAELKKFMDDAIATEDAISSGSVTFGPSDHCTFCPANPHSRGDKGRPFCPAQMELLYPSNVDEDEILNLD